MTQALRAVCAKTAVILEGGYDLAALERSSEAVVRTLMLNPADSEGYEKLLKDLSQDETMTHDKLV